MGIWLKDRYVAPYGWLINKHIREYDLSKANISILLDTGFITKDQYTKYFNMPKQEREISVGILQRDNKEVAKGLSDGFKLIREKFFKENDLNEEEVLYIDKDSITTIDRVIKHTKFSDHLEFKMKKEYTSFYKLPNMDLLYFSDQKLEYFRLKGMGEQVPIIHKNHMVQFLLYVAYMAQFGSIQDCINTIKDFYLQYINKSLDIEYYREMNSRSLYKLLQSGYSSFYANALRQSDISFVDVSENEKIVRELYKIFMNEYFKRK